MPFIFLDAVCSWICSLEREASAPRGGTCTTPLDGYHSSLCCSSWTHTPLTDTKHLSVEHCTGSEQQSAPAFIGESLQVVHSSASRNNHTQSAADNWRYQGNLSKGNSRTQIATSQLPWGFEGGHHDGLEISFIVIKSFSPARWMIFWPRGKPNSVDRIYSEALLLDNQRALRCQRWGSVAAEVVLRTSWCSAS